MEKLLVCNTKMQLTIDEVFKLIMSLDKIDNKNFILCPSILYLTLFANKKYSLCSPNFSSYIDSNHTGEVSISQLKGIGVKYALIGHLDMRRFEDDNIINKKAKLAIKNDIIPIICIGETLEEKSMLKTEKVLKKQIISALRDLSLDKVLLAYNPGWNITIRDKDDIEEIIKFIKNIVELNYKYDKIKVICGDITEKNIKAFNEIETLDGFLTSSTDFSCLNDMIEVIGV